MQSFTQKRTAATDDEIWIVEHPPVFTLGLTGKTEHILNSRAIPIVQTDRGGQVTYHGPGQLVVYPLFNIQRLALNIRQLVTLLESAMIVTLKQYGIIAHAKPEAPGVYVANKKIGAVGLRIKKNCSYHGISLNNAMDLSPFKDINPCGYAGLEVTQLTDFNIHIHTHELAIPVVHAIQQALK